MQRWVYDKKNKRWPWMTQSLTMIHLTLHSALDSGKWPLAKKEKKTFFCLLILFAKTVIVKSQIEMIEVNDAMDAIGRAWFKDRFILMTIFLLGALFSGLIAIIQLVDKSVKNETLSSHIQITCSSIFTILIIAVAICLVCRLVYLSKHRDRISVQTPTIGDQTFISPVAGRPLRSQKNCQSCCCSSNVKTLEEQIRANSTIDKSKSVPSQLSQSYTFQP